MRLVKLYLFVACYGLLITTCYGVEFGLRGVPPKYILEVTGEIEEGDYKKVLSFIKVLGFPTVTWITSPGGDVREAMQLGEFYRDSLMSIMVGEQCNSSCFIWLVGSIQSTAAYGVGLHRPYFDRSWFGNLSSSEATTAYDQMTEELTSYLNRMNVPADIISQMMSTPSNEITYLSAEEFASKLSSPPVFTEWVIANCGALSADEQNDYGVISRIRIIMAQIEGGYITASDNRSRLSALNSRKEKLSAGYQRYLEDETVRIRVCRNDLINEEQETIMEKLRNSAVPSTQPPTSGGFQYDPADPFRCW